MFTEDETYTHDSMILPGRCRLLLIPQNLAIDAIDRAFCVSVLLAVMLNAEAQAFVSYLLGGLPGRGQGPVPF